MSKKTKKSSLRVPDPFRFGCTAYFAGHQVHWIQALRSANNESLHSVGSVAVSAPTWSGKVVSVEGEVLTVRKSDGSLARFRNHDPVRLVFILEHLGVDVPVHERWSTRRAGTTEAGSRRFPLNPHRGHPPLRQARRDRR